MTRRILLVFLAAAASGQKLAPPPDVAARVNQIFSRFDTAATPGCAVGVSINDEPVLAAAYGMADLEHDVPIRPDTVFEAGSVSKQFTATAVLLLVRQGKVALDDDVRRRKCCDRRRVTAIGKDCIVRIVELCAG
jgi:CubicO group peptidase (beta-lactamase class C family)